MSYQVWSRIEKYRAKKLSKMTRSLLFYIFLITFFAIIFVFPTIIWINNYCYTSFDLGIITEAIEKTSPFHLNPFISIEQRDLLSIHWYPILGLISPLKSIIPSRFVVFSVEVVSLVLASFFLYRFTSDRILNAVITAAFLMNVAIYEAIITPSHPITISVLPLAFLFISLKKNRDLIVLGCFFVLCLIREEFFFTAIGLMTYYLWCGNKKYGLFYAFVSAIGAIFVLYIHKSIFGGLLHAGTFFMLLNSPQKIAMLYLGHQSKLILLSLELIPFILIAAFSHDHWFWPLIVVWPQIVLRLVTASFEAHYMTPIVLAVCFVFVNSKLKNIKFLMPLLVVIFISPLKAYYLASETILKKEVHTQVFRQCAFDSSRVSDIERAAEFIMTLPDSETILANGNLVTSISRRNNIVGQHFLMGRAYLDQSLCDHFKYIFYENEPQGEYFMPGSTQIDDYKDYIELLQRTGNHRVIYQNDSVTVATGDQLISFRCFMDQNCSCTN